ncbi:DUF5618 family protein [Dyadobacter diqingensis]|uniref:DUF5618 family protein n=1 Tax=Dyadobacter diqingensis TaxID=2938121 RepID=UPI0020C55E94|nr:DUF5618 family protein [Dyadobacter diqingensis]
MKELLEAKRHLTNARDILSDKARKENGYYQDRKYVKMAGHTAYAGVLVALDSVLGDKKRGRKSVEWYKEELGRQDKKILSAFLAAYDTLHLAMSYDGNLNSKVATAGLEDAEKIIAWVEQKAQA